MIKFINPSKEKPYKVFKQKYQEAKIALQPNIEAMAISSFNIENNEIDSRFVNLKFVEKNKFIFFSNYNSPKAIAFESFNHVSVLFFWHSTNVQIRMKGNIVKTSKKYNDKYFKTRAEKKNALAISSSQSKKISSYKQVISMYEHVRKNSNLKKCPDYWGGYIFRPNYFEFWNGHESRINKRISYIKNSSEWTKGYLEP